MFAKSAVTLTIKEESNSSAKEIVMGKQAENQDIDLEGAVREHYKQVYRFARHLTRHPEDAADLTQHAYEALTQKHTSINDPSKVRSWLQSVVYRKFIDQKRRVIRFPHFELDEQQQSQLREHPDNANKIDAKAALIALYQLEDDLRIPLILFYLESHSYKEIAGILELPVGTIMSRLYRGKVTLFNILNGGKI